MQKNVLGYTDRTEMCKDHETLDCNFCGATVELILSVGMETVMMMQKELFLHHA